jgi:undecaprenyl-diphosphatase
MQTHSNSMLARLSAADAALCVRINRASQKDWVRRLFVSISRLGDGVFWYALMAILLIVQHEAALRPVLHMIAAGLLGFALYKWLKARTLRPRPCDLHPSILRTTAPLDEFSFPSGHTLHAVTFTTVALTYYPALAPLLITFAALVALSRLVLGLHYPSDVLAGAALGYGIAALSFLL